MVSISGNSSSFRTGQENKSSNDTDNNGVKIEITAGKNNVDSGDRSKNTAEVTITTPNKQTTLEVSREQAFNILDKSLTRNTLSQINSPSNNNNTIRKAAISAGINSGQLDQSDAVDVIESGLKFRSAQTAFNSYDNSTNNSIGLYPNNENVASSPDSSAQDLYSLALKRTVKVSLATSANVQNTLESQSNQNTKDAAVKSYQSIDRYK
jgi:hypothetical protein